MGNRTQKQEIARRVAAWLDAVTETLYEAISAGEGVTPPGFGSFYVRAERNSGAFKFNPSQRLRASLGWYSTDKGG